LGGWNKGDLDRSQELMVKTRGLEGLKKGKQREIGTYFLYAL
jgi:hypothetical protein